MTVLLLLLLRMGSVVSCQRLYDATASSDGGGVQVLSCTNIKHITQTPGVQPTLLASHSHSASHLKGWQLVDLIISTPITLLLIKMGTNFANEAITYHLKVSCILDHFFTTCRAQLNSNQDYSIMH